MEQRELRLKEFAVELFKINAIKFGEYKTKVGLMTPVYCDLRVLVSYPKIMGILSDLIIDTLHTIESQEVICGVPYTALPIATIVSFKTNLPMVMRRKEAKDYGTKKLIEGIFQEGDKCLIIEDVVTSGSSILETTKDLIKEGMKVTDAIVLLNREQGGEKFLTQHGIKMHALLTMTSLMKYLKDAGCVTEESCKKVGDYLKNSQVTTNSVVTKRSKRLEMTFEDRFPYAKNEVAKRLFKIIIEKKTNLVLAADLTDATDILNLAESVGPHICSLKLHVDIVEHFNDNFTSTLSQIAKKHNFLLFEDRKFADIGKTVEYQYTRGVYKIASWASLVTAHSLTGHGVLDALLLARGSNELGVFLLAECSAKGSLIDEKYTNATITMGKNYSDLIAGYVCQQKLFVDEPGYLQLTPGVQLGVSGDDLGQQYNSPSSVILEGGADVAVVGRGITKAGNPENAAKEYKDLLWAAYLQRVKQ
ncbi:uridine 5'-monophosphate synthase [Atheta coriaria]|uniref:uridine 5'-monophosphate synthase n=1 Tax=Dalotia coriaria TaxID=877792 RepID=UPI0031F3F598